MTDWTPLGSHPSERARNSIPNWVNLVRGLVLVSIFALMLYTGNLFFYNNILLITIGILELTELAYDWKNMGPTLKKVEITFYSIIIILGLSLILKP